MQTLKITGEANHRTSSSFSSIFHYCSQYSSSCVIFLASPSPLPLGTLFPGFSLSLSFALKMLGQNFELYRPINLKTNQVEEVGWEGGGWEGRRLGGKEGGREG